MSKDKRVKACKFVGAQNPRDTPFYESEDRPGIVHSQQCVEDLWNLESGNSGSLDSRESCGRKL